MLLCLEREPQRFFAPKREVLAAEQPLPNRSGFCWQAPSIGAAILNGETSATRTQASLEGSTVQRGYDGPAGAAGIREAMAALWKGDVGGRSRDCPGVSRGNGQGQIAAAVFGLENEDQYQQPVWARQLRDSGARLLGN